jgi:DNA-directed RNA polymerase II subunit RPB3
VMPARGVSLEVGHGGNPFELDFTLRGTDVSMANAIRRTMIAEVPTMAVELVTVLENTTPLHDEYIAHRLGLIPLVSVRVAEFEDSRNCDCEDQCQRCSVKFVLNESCEEDGTGDEENLTKIITSRHMINSYDSDPLCESVKPVLGSFESSQAGEEEPGITIVKLARGQRIHMVLIARKGIGKEHAKWSPMCTVAYRIEPPAVELELQRMNEIFASQKDTKKMIVEAAEGLLRMDADEQLEYESPFETGRIGITQDTTRQVGELAIAAGYTAADVVRRNPRPERFVFSAETTGAMPPAMVLRIALNIIRDKLGEVQAGIGHQGGVNNDF